MNEVKVARGLGWFSIGLGAGEFIASREFGRILGITARERPVREVARVRPAARLRHRRQGQRRRRLSPALPGE